MGSAVSKLPNCPKCKPGRNALASQKTRAAGSPLDHPAAKCQTAEKCVVIRLRSTTWEGVYFEKKYNRYPIVLVEVGVGYVLVFKIKYSASGNRMDA